MSFWLEICQPPLGRLIIPFVLIKPFTKGIKKYNRTDPDTISSKKIKPKTFEGDCPVTPGGEDHIIPVIVNEYGPYDCAKVKQVDMDYIIEERGSSKYSHSTGKRI